MIFTDGDTRYTRATSVSDERPSLSRFAGHFPFVLKLNTTRTSNDSVLITAVSLQLISLLLILSSKLRKIALPLRYALANGVAESLNRRLMVRTPAMKR